MENTAETNTEDFDEFEEDADLEQGAGEQGTEPGDEAEGSGNDEAEGAEAVADGKKGEKDAEPANPQTKPWKTEENAKNAQVRRAIERKQIEEKAYRKGLIDSVGGVNPYTKEPITDEADINEFLTMREIEKSGGEPIADYASFTKKKLKELAQKAAEEADSAKGKVNTSEDFTEFQANHPGLDFSKLMTDETFQIFSDGKLGRQSLTKIYDDFLKVSGKYEAKADQKVQRMAAKAKASPGSLSGGDPQTLSYSNMPDDEFEKMILKAKRGELSKN